MKVNVPYILRIALLTIFIGTAVFFYYSSPENLINFIGVKNAYILMFVLALLGGLTTFSGIPYHAILIIFASGGLQPIILGILTATGVIAGDTVSYFIGYGGRAIIPQKIQTILQKFCLYCLAHPKISPIAFFLYGAIIPFSNDFIVISMGMARYPFWKVMLPLGLGNFIFNISLAYLAAYSYEMLKNTFLF